MPDKDDSRILVRLPRLLHDALKLEAAKAGISLNELCVQALERRLRDVGARRPIHEPLVEAILKSSLAPKLEAIILFGSQARGDARAASDTDLLLCLQPGAELTRDLYTEWDRAVQNQAPPAPGAVSPHFARLPAAPDAAGSLWLEVAIEGVVLWERSLAVSRFLASLRRHLFEGRGVRRSVYGVPYWVKSYAESKTG